MTRTGDIAPPAITPHPIDPDSPIYRWPYRPVIALERLPEAAYVWDDTDDAVTYDADVITHGYLNGGAFSVATPDPGPPPTSGFVLVQRGRLTTETGSLFPVTARQNDGGDPRAWQCYRNPGATNGGRWWFEASPDGVWATRGNRTTLAADQPAPVLNADETVAIAITPNNGSGRCLMQPWTYNDATATWTARTLRDAGTALVPYDVATVLRVGTGWATTSRLYWAELRTGTDPAAGDVVWRFDADDYPGTGTVFTDPRGRTWTLSAAGAITAAVRNPTAPYVWDAPEIAGGYTDAVCDFHTIELDPGEADELYLFPSTVATITLDNRTGTYTPWSADGRLVYWAPGRRCHVWVLDQAGVDALWLFSGRVASWVANADDTVTITAYDGFAELAQELGGKWTPGAPGETVTARVAAIMTAAAYTDRVDVELGTVTLTAPELESDTSPLEAVQRVALSDGGLFYADADGSIDYRNRTWRAGRADQPRVWAVSDNVCTTPVVVWDPELAADDDRLATDVRMVNTAGLAAVATLGAGSAWAGGARYRLTHPDPDQWTTQAEGDALAAYLLAQQSTPAMAMSRFSLYVADPHHPDVWAMAVGTRRGDLLEVVHEYVDPDGDPAILDTFAIVLGIGHTITPDEWVADVTLSRTVDYRVIEQWDRTRFGWDDTDPLNVWRF